MGLTTDLTLHLSSVETGIPVGFSKPLSELTVDDLLDDTIVTAGAIDKRIEVATLWNEDTGISVASYSPPAVPMISRRKNNYCGYYIDTDENNICKSCGSDNESHNGIYIRSMLALVDNNFQGYCGEGNSIDNTTNIRLVTELDISKVYLNTYIKTYSGHDATHDDPLDERVLTRYLNVRDKSTGLGIAETDYGLMQIAPVWIIVIDGNPVILPGGMCYYYWNYGSINTYGNGITNNIKSFDSQYNFGFTSLLKAADDEYLFEDHPTYIQDIEYDYDGRYSNYKAWYSANDRYPYYWTLTVTQTIQMILDSASWAGLYFKFDDVMYKPIIQGGIVTGYTDDMTIESEIDDWTTINNHDIPVTPPVPDTSDDDDIDDMSIGSMSYTNGFVKYYRVTKGNLDSIAQKLTEQTEYTDLTNNIVSLKSYIINTDHYIVSTRSEDVSIGAFDTEVAAERITATKSAYELGSYHISGKYGNADNPHFLDKSPYCKIEVYIPYCGTIELPDICMYKTIDVYLLSDILNGTCQGVVKCDGNIIAQKSGIIAVDVPITSTDNALKYNACLSSVLSSVNSIGSLGFAAATGNPSAAFSGITSAINSANNYRVAQTANYTRVIGSQGDAIENALPDTCFIKIFHTIAREPEGYAHKYGKPCNKYKRLADCNGFTQCFNPTISGNMTDSERNKIISLLNQGIFL